jgi:hypothetical protein
VCSVVVSIDSMFSRSMTDTVLSTHIILLIDEWGDMCFSMSMCLYFADVSTLTENDERSTIGIKLSWKSDFAFLWRVWEVLKILFFQIQGLSVYHFIFVVYFMMVWYGAFRSLVYSTRIPHFGGC